GVGCERGQAPRANVVWTRRRGRISTPRTRARRPRRHLRRTAAERDGLALPSSFWIAHISPALRIRWAPLGQWRGPVPLALSNWRGVRRRNDEEPRRGGGDHERWRRDGSIHAAGVPTGGRPGGAGRARAGDADVRGAAPQPARGGAAGGRPAPAFHGERDVGARTRWRDGDHRRPVRDYQGGPGRLLHPRLRRPRRGTQAGCAGAGSALRDGRGAPDDVRRGVVERVARGRRRPARRGGRRHGMSGGVHAADPVSLAVARAFRDERAIVLATLIRQAGDFQLAEDAVQDAFEAAVTAWRRDGVPANPGRGSRRRRGGGRSTVCVATGRWRIAPS